MTATITIPTSVEEFYEFRDRFYEQNGGLKPAAFAIGWSRSAVIQADGTYKMLDADFQTVNFGSEFGTAAVIATVLGLDALPTGTYSPTDEQYRQMLDMFEAFKEDGAIHSNIDALRAALGTKRAFQNTDALGHYYRPIIAVISNLDDAPASVGDAYLRLYLLSRRDVKPHGVNVKDIFKVLNNVVWSNVGPIDPERYDSVRGLMRHEGRHLHVYAIDKFPQMLDYVMHPDFRIANGDRVRLGAYIGKGTTVMHEGFVNFNGGAEGPNMIEGRISAGVWVAADSDIGGGASTMGTLSGGGDQVISIGKNCLVGAEAGIGISLGDNCVVEAGTYVTAGMLVTVITDSGEQPVKARELSGKHNLLFRRNSVTGRVEVLPNKVQWGGLNDILHDS